MQSKKYFKKKAKRVKRRELERFKTKIGNTNKCLINSKIMDIDFYTNEFGFISNNKDIEIKKIEKKKDFIFAELIVTGESRKKIEENTNDINISWNGKVGNPSDDLKGWGESALEKVLEPVQSYILLKDSFKEIEKI